MNPPSEHLSWSGAELAAGSPLGNQQAIGHTLPLCSGVDFPLLWNEQKLQTLNVLNHVTAFLQSQGMSPKRPKPRARGIHFKAALPRTRDPALSHSATCSWLSQQVASLPLYLGWEQQPWYLMLAQVVLLSIHYHPLPSKSAICLQGAKAASSDLLHTCPVEHSLLCALATHIICTPHGLCCPGALSSKYLRLSCERESSRPTQSQSGDVVHHAVVLSHAFSSWDGVCELDF